ncbi:hypothetical protein IJD15_06105 [bacterium]|nr:hypothetical protein [bacterium]
MQVRQVNTVNSQRQLKRDINNNKNTNFNVNINNQKQQNPSFKGGLDGFCLGLANLIENGGLFISFTLQDMLGTNLPRPIMGLMRNSKENNGEKNTKFAAKELVREMLTGPSMFLIPMGLLKLGKPVLGETIDVPRAQIKALGDIHAANPLNAAGQTLTKKEFYQNAFTEIIKNAKSEPQATEETIKKAGEFAEKLATSLAKDKKSKSKAIGELADDFVGIAKQHAKDAAHTDFTVAKLSQTTAVPFKDGVKSIVAYADDVVGKVKGQDAGKLSEAIKKVANNKSLVRVGVNVGMYAAVIAFLKIIPKLYNKAEGEGNAGLKGLMKEETLNSSAPEKKENSNVLQAQINKSNPSFGSASSVAKNLGTKALNAFEFEGCNVSFPMLLGLMAIGVIIPRINQAKDKYDREEILRRDLVTCATMCFGEKILQKGFSKANETKSGFVLASKKAGFKNQNVFKKFFDYIRPIKGVKVMSTDQIISKYSGLDKYKDGIKGFCDFISGQGGNLGKVFSISDDAKNIVNGLLQAEGKTIANADNAAITSVLDKAKDSAEVKKLTSLFSKKDNPWVTKARTLNARFTALSVLVLVPAFLGFMLPAINERATKKRINEEKAAAEKQKSDSLKAINPDFFSQSTKTQNIFSDFQ